MKRKPIYRNYIALLLVCMAAFGCNDHHLDDFASQPSDPSGVTAGGVSGEIQITNEQLIVPISVHLNSAASRAFEVGLELDADTVQALIDGGTLDASPIPNTSIVIPNSVKVAFGADSAVFDVAISVSTLERLYGQTVAFAYNLKGAGKGNQLSQPHSSVIVLNTEDLLNQEDIHYLSITNGGGGILEANNRQNYSSTSAGLSMPLGITLTGEPGRSFSVHTEVNTDTIATLVTRGTLPENTVALSPEQYTLDTLVNVGPNLSSAPMVISVPWSVINDNQDKELALSIRIKNPTRHVIDESKSNVVILIHPQLVVEVDVTNDGAFSVSRDNNDGPTAGEGSLKLIDNNLDTKFFQSNFAGDLWVQLVYEEPQLIGAYTMTSANDAEGRDPKNWNLQGSMDGENWVTLDTRTDEDFPTRFQTKRYDFTATVAYTHYRLNITATAGDGVYQQAEWRLIRVP